MSRAFDSIPHHLLLLRLSKLQLPDHELFVNWVNSYVTNRKQRVRLLDTLSSVVDVTSGVPQGSVLGPFLFAIFLSSYHAFFHDSCVIKYADDVTLVLPVYKRCREDMSQVNQEISHFECWCKENGMTINTDKSKCMNVLFIKESLPLVPVLQTVKTLKILGVIFNCKLTWCDHFNYVCAKVRAYLDASMSCAC